MTKLKAKAHRTTWMQCVSCNHWQALGSDETTANYLFNCKKCGGIQMSKTLPPIERPVTRAKRRGK
jgi:hypothetical protein